MRHEDGVGRVARQLRPDRVRLRRDEGDALLADEVRAGDAVQHRPELILNRRPAVGLVAQLTYPVGRLTDRLRDVVERTDDVDRRLQDRVGRPYTAAQRFTLRRRQRRHLADLRACGAQHLDHCLGCQCWCRLREVRSGCCLRSFLMGIHVILLRPRAVRPEVTSRLVDKCERPPAGSRGYAPILPVDVCPRYVHTSGARGRRS